jgi:pyrroline-5-carboxylate reductase
MKIGIIGCGVIGSGFATHFSKQHSLLLYDIDKNSSTALANSLGPKAEVAQSLKDLTTGTAVTMLAVKPQCLNDVGEALSSGIHVDHLFISTLAGVTVERLKQHFSSVPILRIMPNIACFHHQGVIALVEDAKISEKAQKTAEELFEGLGISLWVPEKNVDAITALSGSGPAYVFVLIEAMVDAGINMGLTPTVSKDLVLQTIQGAVTMTLETGKHPGELKWQVSSPSGTTIAGLQEMEKRSVRAGMMETIMAAFRRAKELGNE